MDEARARVLLSCDEIAFSGVMRVKFYPSRNYLYLQRVVRDTTRECPLTHATNDAMQFQESFALPPDLLLTVCLFLLQVSRNSSLVSRNFLRINKCMYCIVDPKVIKTQLLFRTKCNEQCF